VGRARIIYTPRPEVTSETEATVLAAVYRFVLDCHAKKKGSVPNTADDAKEKNKDDRTDKANMS
jgi:hypothetical protein